MNWAQDERADRRSAHRKLLSMTLNTRELFWNWRNFTLMLTRTTEYLQRKYNKKLSYRLETGRQQCISL